MTDADTLDDVVAEAETRAGRARNGAEAVAFPRRGRRPPRGGEE
jgi:hypothetical protein